jgi:hypothetical protein
VKPGTFLGTEINEAEQSSNRDHPNNNIYKQRDQDPAQHLYALKSALPLAQPYTGLISDPAPGLPFAGKALDPVNYAVRQPLRAPRSLRVALGSQPVDAAGSLQPLVNLGFALEPLDVSRFGSRIFGEDLPIILGDPLHFEGDSGFGHVIDYAPSGLGRKPKSGMPYSN